MGTTIVHNLIEYTYYTPVNQLRVLEAVIFGLFLTHAERRNLGVFSFQRTD